MNMTDPPVRPVIDLGKPSLAPLPDALPAASPIAASPVVETRALAESASYKIPPIHREGHKFVAIAVLATLIVGFGLEWTTLGWLLAGLTLWVAAFFRDPERVTPADAQAIVSPADGLVSLITTVEPPRQLIGEGGLSAAPCVRISVFMNVFDVHVNRSPIAGLLTRIVYVPGKFLNADLDKASDDNERQYFVVEDAVGTRVAFTQIAGLIARRIVRFVETGTALAVGQRVGLIRFGSRVDVYLPAGYAPQVAVGQRAVAGETVLARAGAAPLHAATRQ